MLKLQFKTFSELLRYVNFGAVAACRVLCVSRTVFRMSLVMVVRRVLCSVRLSRCTAHDIVNFGLLKLYIYIYI